MTNTFALIPLQGPYREIGLQKKERKEFLHIAVRCAISSTSTEIEEHFVHKLLSISL